MASSDSDTATLDNVADFEQARRTKLAKQSATSAKKPGNRTFNKEKVERIKAAIADGSYKIDPASIANKFIEHERN